MESMEQDQKSSGRLTQVTPFPNLNSQGVSQAQLEFNQFNNGNGELEILNYNNIEDYSQKNATENYMNMIEDMPFHEYNYKKILKPQKNLVYFDEEEIQRYKAEWHWDQFFEFAFYHFMYFIVLGPFSTIVFFRKPGKILLQNMQFIGWGFLCRWQFVIWLVVAGNILYYFWQEDQTITLTEILFMWSAIIQRLVVISAKYATLSQERLQLYKDRLTTLEEKQWDMFFYDWRAQSLKLRLLEIQRALKRHQLDQNNFHIEFIVALTEQTSNKVVNKDQLEAYRILGPLEKLKEKEYCGFQILSHFIQTFQEKTRNCDVRIRLADLFSMILTITPLVYNHNKIFHMYDRSITFGVLQTIRLLVNTMMTYQLFFTTYLFLILGIYDQQRKIYLLNQCQYMLSTSKLILDDVKLVPTINIYNLRSLIAWAMLRTVSYDYGQTYNLRSQGFFSFVFILASCFFVIFLVIILNLRQFGTLEMILICEMATIIYSQIAIYLYYGATLNSYFDVFESQLQDLKTVYIDIIRAKDRYFVERKEPRNFLHKKIVEYIGKNIGQDIKQIDEYLKQMIQTVKDLITNLEYDRRNHPFQLYGFTVTFNLLKSVLVGLATVAGYAIQQRLNPAGSPKGP